MLLNEFLKEHRKVESVGEPRQVREQIDLSLGPTESERTVAAASPSRGGLEAGKFATGRIRRGGPAPQVVNNP